MSNKSILAKVKKAASVAATIIEESKIHSQGFSLPNCVTTKNKHYNSFSLRLHCKQPAGVEEWNTSKIDPRLILALLTLSEIVWSHSYIVKQYHFTAWTDDDQPDKEKLFKFLLCTRYFTQLVGKSSTLIHRFVQTRRDYTS